MMILKHIVIVLALSFALSAAQLTVNVETKKACEQFKFSVCAEDEKFPPNERGCRISLVSPVKNGVSKFDFRLEKSGRYAVAGYCDENNDKILNRYWTRIPKEPYGVSRFEGGILPPTFDESCVMVENAQSVILKVIYP